MSRNERPLEGLLVLEFAQFLAGPLCGLRLADMGARVIKIERPGVGELGRGIYLGDVEAGGTNTLFQAINRNKESFAANLKAPDEFAAVLALLSRADVVIQNFRPGVFDRLGFSYKTVSQTNRGLVYGSVTGYGNTGPWVDLPGQDLLAQARSGLMWLNGSDGSAPQPVGLSVADMLAGHNLTQGILAALVRRGVTGKGSEVETSLLESLVDFQFEVLTAHFNDGQRPPKRSNGIGAHSYLPAPYGVYPTSDSFLAIAMTPVDRLMTLLAMPEAGEYADPARAFADRERILNLLADRLRTNTTTHWLDILQPRDIWCAEVLNWPDLLGGEAFKALDMVQDLHLPGADPVRTTRIPITFDQEVLKSTRPAPAIGADTEAITAEFEL